MTQIVECDLLEEHEIADCEVCEEPVLRPVCAPPGAVPICSRCLPGVRAQAAEVGAKVHDHLLVDGGVN